MSDELTIVAIAPELFNPNGDVENARVLARRCAWAGLDARVLPVSVADEVPDRVDAVVVGSCSDSQVMRARDLLLGLRPMLGSAMDSAAPVLAIGTGLELLGESIEVAGAAPVPALGLIPARAVCRAGRVTGELVVDSAFGRLVGYENHARDLVVDGDTLGVVVAGNGNGSGHEGLVTGSVYGTHLHGPVLAKNPALADHLLTAMAARVGERYRPGAQAEAADSFAAAARRAITTALKLGE